MVYTIKDVANKSRVSIGTVSKVLNNYPNVSETTKKKVMEAIHECVELAPLHNPANILGIEACQELMPGTPMVAVFKDGKYVNGTVGYTEYDAYAKFLEESGLSKK